MNKNLSHSEICKLIIEAQTIIATLLSQNKIEVLEECSLRKASGELQKVFDTQFAESCKSLVNKIVDELLGVNVKVFKED